MFAGGGYELCLAEWYYILVNYVFALVLTLCNAYGVGLTVWSLANLWKICHVYNQSMGWFRLWRSSSTQYPQLQTWHLILQDMLPNIVISKGYVCEPNDWNSSGTSTVGGLVSPWILAWFWNSTVIDLFGLEKPERLWSGRKHKVKR